jgi:chitinase
MIRLSTLALTVVVGLVSCAVRAIDSDKVVLGYVYGMPAQINYDLYTHLCHAFVVAEKDGKLIPQDNVPNRQLTTDAHRAGVKVLLSLGGWGWDANFSEMSLDSAAEGRYVESIIALVDEFDYDGIDLDWEYPDTNIEIVGFERLTRKFRNQLDALESEKGRPMLMTMAAAAHPKTLQWLSNGFLLETMDWVNVMTYDYYGSWSNCAGHHSPLFVSSQMPEAEQPSTASSIKYLLDRKLPPDRIALGLPLYGRAFGVDQPYVDTAGARKPRRESYNYKQIAPLLTDPGWTRQWDDETKNPWLIARDGSEIVGYDDAKSIAIKTRWALDLGLRGVFFWQIDADRIPNGRNPLQEAATNILSETKSLNRSRPTHTTRTHYKTVPHLP